METLLNQLSQLSSNLINRITSCEMEDLDVYMKEREGIFAKLQQLPSSQLKTPEARSIFEQIRQQDSIINHKLEQLRDEANNEIEKINKGKRTKSLYESETYDADSLFFDAKR